MSERTVFQIEVLDSTPLDLSELSSCPKLDRVHRWWQGFPDWPTIQDIDPLDLPPQALQDIVVLEHTRDDGFRVRLAGTRLYDLYGREISGETVADACEAGSVEQLEQPFRLALEEGRAVLFRRRIAVRNNRQETYLLLAVPLRAGPADCAGVLMVTGNSKYQKDFDKGSASL